MRYRELLVVLFIVSTAVLLWAEPARDLSQPKLLSQGKQSLSSEPSEVSLEIRPGKDFASTEFIVAVNVVQDGLLSEAPVALGIRVPGEPHVAWTLVSPRKGDDGRWHFFGADLRMEGTPAPTLGREYRGVVTLMDTKASPYARSIPTQTFESQTVRLAGR